MIQRTLAGGLRLAARPLFAAPRTFQTTAALRRPARLITPPGRIAAGARRCYSEVAESKQDPSAATQQASAEATSPKDDAAKAPAGGEAAKQLEEKTKELEAKSKELISIKDQYLRQVADYRNLQDRTKREVQAARDFGVQRFAKDILDSIDNFERALSNTPAEALVEKDGKAADKDLVNLHSGLKMTETILMQALEKNGLVRFDPAEKEEPFDPNMHEALFNTPQPDKKDGVVFHTQQKGFTLNGRVLRAAKVGVVKNS